MIGWVFKDCTFNGDGDGVDGSFTLGRPWGKGTPVAVFIDTKMNVTPKAIGWEEMSGGWPARFAEYNSMSESGYPVDLSNRKTVFASTHSNNPELTADEANEYSDMSRMFSDWQPTLLTEEAPAVTDVVLDGNILSWTGNSYALLYAICINDEVAATTTETSYDISSLKPAASRGNAPSAAPVFSVRAANAMGGLSAPVIAQDPTGISEINTNDATTISTEIFTADGKRVNTLHHGINIVRYKMADGSVKTVKVMR